MLQINLNNPYDLEGIFSKIGAPVEELRDYITDMGTRKTKFRKGSVTKANKKLKEIYFTEAHGLMVRMPENSILPFQRHLEVLEDHIEQLMTVEERTLKPLLKWSFGILEDREFINKAWLQENISFQDINVIKKEFVSVTKDYNDTSKNFVPFTQMFQNAEELNRCSHICERLETIIEDLEKRKIVDTTDMIYDNIENATKPDELSKSGVRNVNSCGIIVSQVAEEVSQLSLTIFAIKKSLHAFTTAIDSFNTYEG